MSELTNYLNSTIDMMEVEDGVLLLCEPDDRRLVMDVLSDLMSGKTYMKRPIFKDFTEYKKSNE